MVTGVTGSNGWSSRLWQIWPLQCPFMPTHEQHHFSSPDMLFVWFLLGLAHYTCQQILSWRKAGVTVWQPTWTILYIKPQLHRLCPICPIRMWWCHWMSSLPIQPQDYLRQLKKLRYVICSKTSNIDFCLLIHQFGQQNHTSRVSPAHH